MTTQYLDLLQDIRDNGQGHDDRTGTGTLSVFGRQIRFDLNEGFPLLTTKKLAFRWIAEELIWMLSGSTNEKDLAAKGVDIWKEWATEEQCARFGRQEGDLGPVYGHQWRNFGAWEMFRKENGAEYMPATVLAADGKVERIGYAGNGTDQIANVVDMLINNPNSRRILLTGWNPNEATQVALPPCHTLTQFIVRDGKISAQLYQRSADVFLGVPYNIASYALLVHMLAHVTGLGVGDFVHTFGDVHIYRNHLDQVEEQLGREPRALPYLGIGNRYAPGVPLDRLLNLTYDDFGLVGYNPHGKIKAEVSV